MRYGAIVLGAVLCGAAPNDAPPPTLPPFSNAAVAPYLRAGTGVIEGRLVVQLPDGILATRERSPVLALPDTAFSTAWLRASAVEIARPRTRGAPTAEPALPAVLDRFARGTHTDAAGYFHFRSLPKGRYVLRGRLTIAFPRSILRNDIRETVYDYSYVWLQSDAIPVGDAVAPDVAFHIVARRDSVVAKP